jgi:hypothetical protein
MASVPPEIEQVIEQVRVELLRMADTSESGTVTIHCGANQFVVEANRKLEPIRRQARAKTPARGSWK